METTHEALDGLSNFGSSEEVSNIADFLSLEELGITEEKASPDGIELPEDTDNPAFSPKEEPKVEETDSEKAPEVDLGLDDIDLGEEDAPTSGGNGSWKELISELIEEGIWDGIDSFETEDGKEIPFEEMDIDKETLISLIRHNQEELKKKVTENTVTTEGISEFTKKLISIEKHGGNVQKALDAFQTVKEPLDSIDITTVGGQKAICYLRLQQNGINGEEAKDLIDSYEMKGVLEDKSLKFKEELDSAFTAWLDKQEEMAIQEDQAYRDSLKAYKSALNEALKSKSEFNLSETHRKKLLEVATKEREDGLFPLDEMLDNHRRNPLDAADLILFLSDKDAYIQAKAKHLLDEQNKQTLKKISIIPKAKSTANLGDKQKTSSKDLISLDKLI